jgi:hypothetical protein
MRNDSLRMKLSSELCGGTAFDLLKFEFVGPSDHRTPDQRIHQHNHSDHGGKSPKHGARIAAAGGGLQKRAEAGQAEVLVAENKHFARHEEEPTTGHRHHGIPDQADRRERKIEFEETLPGAEAVDDGGFAQVARNGFQGRIETESDVPDLAGEDKDDGAELDPKLAAGKNSYHRQHDRGKKTQNRNGLQNVQKRDQDHLRTFRFCRGVAVDEGKNEAQAVGNENPDERIERIQRQAARILGDFGFDLDRSEPGTSDGIQAEDGGKNRHEHGDVDQESPGPTRAGGPKQRRRNRRRLCGDSGGSGHRQISSRSASIFRWRRRNRKVRRSGPTG